MDKTAADRFGGMTRRILRLRDVPIYLGMDRNRFNAEFRPFLTEIPIGVQGIGFDRLEIDALVDDYVARNGRPAKKGRKPWDARQRPVLFKEAGSGTSTNALTGDAFNAALEHVGLKKPKQS